MIKAKSEYFRSIQLSVVSLTENNAFKNKVKNQQKNQRIPLMNYCERNKNDTCDTWRLIKTLSNNSADNKAITNFLTISQ